MVCMAHRLQCKTLYFPKHKLPMHTTQNVLTHLKSTVNGGRVVRCPLYRVSTFWQMFLFSVRSFSEVPCLVSNVPIGDRESDHSQEDQQN